MNIYFRKKKEKAQHWFKDFKQMTKIERDNQAQNREIMHSVFCVGSAAGLGNCK